MLLALALTALITNAAPDGPPYPRIADCYAAGLGPTSTAKDLAEIARFDLLIGGVWCNWADPEQRRKLATNLAEVRRLNPRIIVLDFSCSAPYADPKDPTFPKDGWLLQPDGRHITGWPGTDMINLTRADVLEWLASRCVRSVTERGFDGVFIDCMGTGFDAWACNIELHEPYQVDADGDGRADDRKGLDETWTHAKTVLAERVRAAIGDRPFMTNQAGDWGKPSMNGILLEDYLDYVLDGHASWDRVLSDYLGWTTIARRPNLTTIVSSSGVDVPYNPWKLPKAEQEALLERGRNLLPRMRFGLATTLLGDGFYAYDMHTRWRGQRFWYPEYDAPLGHPKGPAQRRADGAWRREFDGGTVVCNPTPFDVPVTFADRQRDVSADRVDTAFVVPAQDGRIYLPTADLARAGSLAEPTPALTFAGAEPAVERGDRVLVRLGTAAALFDPEGRMRALADARGTLAENLSALVVTSPWRDYAYRGVTHTRDADRVLRFRGERVDGETVLAFDEEVRPGRDRVTVSTRWTARTAARFVLFRPQLDLPVSAYGGGRANGTVLPVDKAPQPNLLSSAGTFAFSTRDGRRLTATAAPPAYLNDERHYGVPAYRLGQSPVKANTDLPAGTTWEATVELMVP